jgi:ABC-type polysaccharide/polyol phosphate transport system ATPase subunit
MPVSASALYTGFEGERPLAAVNLEGVTVDFPIYGSRHRSIRTAFLGKTGGLIRREGSRQQRVTVRALENVSFQLEHGDRLGLIGPNGAGKSTLLRVLSGIYEPTFGNISVEGRVSPLFIAAPGIDHDDTGYENIYTCGMYLGMTNKEIENKMADIEGFSELGDYLLLPVRTYSTGMLMRLGFALATALDPDLLLLDEGLGAGDTRFAARAEKRLEKLIERSSILVLASHSNELIKSLCNKGALMDGGHLVAMGQIDEIIEQYKARAGSAA